MCWMGPADPADKAGLTRLWLAAFPTDTPADVEGFWETGYTPAQAFVCKVEDEIVSMAFCLPAKIENVRLGYVFGVATLPSHRGQGYSTRLLAALADHARKSGLDGLFLHPATPDLEGFYSRLGYAPAFYVEEITLTHQEMTNGTPSAISALPLPPPARQAWLERHGISAVDWPESGWAYSLGDDYLVAEDWMGFCALDGRHLTVRELLCEEATLPAVCASLCHTYDFDTCILVRPTRKRATVFGMLKPLSPVGEALLNRPLYMGPAME